MGEYKVTYYWTQSVEFDVEDLKEEFPESWEAADEDEEGFIENVVDEVGFSYLEEMDILTESETYKGYVEVEKVQ